MDKNVDECKTRLAYRWIDRSIDIDILKYILYMTKTMTIDDEDDI